MKVEAWRFGAETSNLVISTCSIAVLLLSCKVSMKTHDFFLGGIKKETETCLEAIMGQISRVSVKFSKC